MAQRAFRLQRVPEELSLHQHPICLHSGTRHPSAVHIYCFCHDRQETWPLCCIASNLLSRRVLGYFLMSITWCTCRRTC